MQDCDCVLPLDRVTVLGVKESPCHVTIDGNAIVDIAFNGDKHTLSMGGLNCVIRDSFSILWL